MSSDSSLPKAPSVPSVSPRINVVPAPSPIGPLQRQSPVRDSMPPVPSFNDPVSVYYPLPRRIKMSPRSITHLPPPPELVAQHAWLNFQDQNRGNFEQLQREFQQQTELSPRLSPSRRSAQAVSIFEPFRNHMHTESGHTTLDLDDGTIIDMGNVEIDTALGMLRRLIDSNGNVTYKVDGFTPEIEMIILPDGRIIPLRHPPALTYTSSPSRNLLDRMFGRSRVHPQPQGGRRRTRARKMGRNGTNKRHRRRRCMNHTRRKSLFIFRRR